MPSLEQKNGAPRWRGTVMVNGVKHRQWFPDDSLTSKRTATAWELAEKKKMQRTQSNASPTLSTCSVHEWATRYLQDVQSRFSQVTLNEKITAFRRLMSSLAELGIAAQEAPITALTSEIAMRHLQAQNSARSGYAANKDRKNLASGWKWGATFMDSFPRGMMNPFALVPKFREIRSPRYVPPVVDFWRVVDMAEGQDKVMLLAYLYLAARRKELFGLKWEDVDFSQDRIRLWTNKREGGREFDWLPMAAALKEALVAWRSDTPYPNAEHVFVATYESCSPTHKAGEPFQYRQHLMGRLCKKAGLRMFTFHAIRHLTAVELSKEGFRIGLIQKVLRHRNARTTEIYLRSLGMDMGETREALEGLGFGPNTRSAG